MDEEKNKQEYEEVLTSYYKDETVSAIISLKVDTKYADKIAARASKSPNVVDAFLVTGDTDIILKASFETYGQLKDFIVAELGSIQGVKDTQTMMVVTTFKEAGEAKIEDDDLE